MSTIDRILNALRRVPRGFSADGRRLGLGLAAALNAPIDETTYGVFRM